MNMTAKDYPRILTALPVFTFDDYERMLKAFLESGYTPQPISTRHRSERTVYFRHDVDFFLHDWQAMPQIENRLGICATYYILPSSYNILNRQNRRLIRNLVALGHEIGLHFDPTHYPDNPVRGRERFEFEISVLENIGERQIKTVSRHNVFRTASAKFDYSDFIDPWDESFRRDMIYISDSVRAWRDETLLTCFGDNPPPTVQLLTHPELWLNGACQNRIEYMRVELLPRMDVPVALKEDYLSIWATHEAALLHDERVRGGER